MAQQFKTILGEDGILRSSGKVDLTVLPNLDGCSFVKFLLDQAKEQLLENADLGEVFASPSN